MRPRSALFTARSTLSAGGLAVLGVLLASGCATYHSKPLPAAPDLADAPILSVPASRLGLPPLEPHSFDPAAGLDETTVMTLAVLDDPDLRAARAKWRVADAQVLEAGLLPDPRIGGGLFRSAFFTGYDLQLSEDLQALVTRGAARAAANAGERQVNLEILWQETQVAEKARELFIESVMDEQLQRVLAPMRDLLASFTRQEQVEFTRGDVTATLASADLQLLAEADANLRKVQLDLNQTRHALNQLLGLKPGVELRLMPRGDIPAVSQERLWQAVAALGRRRPDLLALQAGYESQEEQLREAVLAQFPGVSAGVERARSAEEGVTTRGFTVEVTLPLFNRNRGRIAIERASRAVLHQTYQARLDQAMSDADQLWQATQIMAAQLRSLEVRLPALAGSVAAAAQSYGQGRMDAAEYVALKSSFATEEAQELRLRASFEKAQGALRMLLGIPL